MSGPGRRLIGVWVALAIALAVALGLFKGEAAGLGKDRGEPSEAWIRPDGTIVVRVLGPVLY